MKDYKNWKQQLLLDHDIFFICLDDISNRRTLPPIAIGEQDLKFQEENNYKAAGYFNYWYAFKINIL